MKEFKVPIPEGMEIDKENSTFECIKFKPIKPKRWRDDKNATMYGFYITTNAKISNKGLHENDTNNYNVFSTEKQAKSALAMARISQIMANDERFGGVITDNEWDNGEWKYCIIRYKNNIEFSSYTSHFHFLAFHTEEQRNLFLKENEDLVNDFLMID